MEFSQKLALLRAEYHGLILIAHSKPSYATLPILLADVYFLAV